VLATPRQAALLESTTAKPLLRLHRRSLDTEGQPIEVVRSLYRGDRVAFEARLD
jgi:GntR family transcriptional regulator